VARARCTGRENRRGPDAHARARDTDTATPSSRPDQKALLGQLQTQHGEASPQAPVASVAAASTPRSPLPCPRVFRSSPRRPRDKTCPRPADGSQSLAPAHYYSTTRAVALWQRDAAGADDEGMAMAGGLGGCQLTSVRPGV